MNANDIPSTGSDPDVSEIAWYLELARRPAARIEWWDADWFVTWLRLAQE